MGSETPPQERDRGAVREVPEWLPGSGSEDGLPPPPPLPRADPPQALPPGGDFRPDVLEPGVVVSVQVTGEQSLSLEEGRIGADGTLFMPFLGRIQASGSTPATLARHLEQTLAEGGLLGHAQVNVEVLQHSGRRAYVLGRVQRPGAYDLPFHRPVTLLQLIAEAGGLWRSNSPLDADDTAIRFIRTTVGPDGQSRRTYRLSFDDIVADGDVDGDIVMQDGDVIYVPPKRQLYVFGAVREPGTFPLAERERLTADEVLALAGGFAEEADEGGVLLIRRGPEGARTYRIPVDPRERSSVLVIPGDTIIVRDRGVQRVYVLGAVTTPGAIEIDDPEMSVIDALGLAGGPDRNASTNSIKLIRRGRDGERHVYTVPMADILDSGDLERDPRVLPGDIIFVPERIF
jgi:polysaccharide biosynthesis/export protein